MHYEPRGLIDHEDVGVLVDDRKVDRLGARGALRGPRRKRHFHRLSALQSLPRARMRTIAPPVPFLKERGEPPPRLVRKKPRERLTGATARQFERNGQT